ncbi:MAG: hypothetical protein R3C44_08150 [Chloroflexota bacterium]
MFTYTSGYDLIMQQDDPQRVFVKLLTEQVLPSELAANIDHE